ncbi:hypothetical protein QC763_308655 [Podospora pseudopauciseta]|uniref:Uncharacterized protein n=2 Tax=Podospora TaxID=5144 RepID=A0ABR0HHL6_9PEZI|nr:hypothetical protein QC763_308655 [Podospora pseudopauciseta]KAK4678550.1 hypothetical protein QC764_308655 [Podospora pseudoanserina]
MDDLQTTEFDIGSIEVATINSDLSIVLTSSCVLSLPAIWDHVPDAIELYKASSEAIIWIAKAGGDCRVEFSTLLNGEPLDVAGLDPDTEVTISHLAAGCGIWLELGLDLRLKHATHPELEHSNPEAVYFLHHPDLSSSLIAPPELPFASFQELKVDIHYHINMSYSTDDQTEATETTGLPLEDRLEEAMTLLDIGLQKLIGVKKSIPGVKVTKSNNDLPSLIGIAPAVWNIPYLQSMTVHAQMIPSLARSIVRLKHSQSPSLRRKVEGLMPGDIDPEIWDVDDEIEDEIRKRLWLRCQTGIRSDPIQRISTSQTNADDNRQEEAPQRLLGGPKSAEERCGPRECGEAIINPLQYASTANQLAHYCGIPEGIYDDDNDYDEGYDADDSPLETDSFSPYSSSDIRALHSDDWQGSSEAEYFYTDGQGNVVTLQQDSDSTEPEAVGWDRSSSIDTMDFE